MEHDKYLFDLNEFKLKLFFLETDLSYKSFILA